MSDVLKSVSEIIAEQAMVEADTIKPETAIEDLGLDSLALVEVVFGIEEAFDVSVPYNANEPGESEFKLDTVGEIVSGISAKYRPIADLAVKKGPFYVLFLSDMPAILLEAGFLTNRGDAKRLRDEAYLQAMADRIATGLERYRGDGQQLAQSGLP